jgi:hypothetical protein
MRLSYLNRFANGIQVNTWGEVGVSASEQTFLDDQNQDGALAGELDYTFGNRGSVTARGLYRSRGGRAHASGITHRGLGVEEDSLATIVGITLTNNARVDAYYHRYAMTNEFMDLPRGVFLEQQFNENLVRENETRTAEILRVNAVANPNGRLQLAIGAQHSQAESQFRTAVKRNGETITDGINAFLVYNMWRGASVRFDLANVEVLHDLGANSLGTFTDKRQTVRANLVYPVTSTLRLQLGVGTTLFQNFYRDFIVNPRDRDQLDQYINLNVTSQPFPKISARVYLSANQTDFVNISGSLSQNNRKETTYDFRPGFTYKITERVELRQEYGLNIEFTEYVFTEEDNFLDRNFLFANTIRAR